MTITTGREIYLHQDSDGSVFAATNSSGLLAAYSYSAFGEPHEYSKPGTAVSNRFLFQGALFDPWTANYSMRAREYVPALARFASIDPIGMLGGTPNLYGFVFGNPLSFTDPLGLRPSVHGRLRTWIDGIVDDATSIKHLQTATNFVCGVGDACLGVFGIDGDSVRGAYGVRDGADTTSTAYGLGLASTEVALAVAGDLVDSEEVYEAYKNYSDGGDTSTSVGGGAGDSASSNSSARPSFVVTQNGEAIPVPNGATGPSPAWNNKGFMFENGSGGNGLDPRVSNVRIMDPTGVYPGGYVNYGNESWQSVDPYTGQTVSKGDPAWHIPLR